MKSESENVVGRAAELFAGVGGFRLGLSKAGFQTVFSNQWEPGVKRQHASEVYVHNFGPEGHSNVDIAAVQSIPENFDLLVGGFPCQDYSVAKSRSAASGQVSDSKRAFFMGNALVVGIVERIGSELAKRLDDSIWNRKPKPRFHFILGFEFLMRRGAVYANVS